MNFKFLNEYIILIITIVVIYEIIFSILVRPYYVKKMMNESIKKIKFPEVSFEAFILLTVVFGIAFGNSFDLDPYLFLGPIFLVYGIASFSSKKFNFYLATALLFNFFRKIPYKEQLKKQKTIVIYLNFIISVGFFIASYFYM